MKQRKRAIEYLITLFCIITLNFLLPRMMPGDPFTFLSTEEGSIAVVYAQDSIDANKAYYGLDKPLFEQYMQYIADLCRGNLGRSIYYNDSVAKLVGERAVWTIAIVSVSLVVGCVMGIALGCFSAFYYNSWVDKFLYFLMLTLSEIPPFIVGVLLLFALAAGPGWFPLAGGRSMFVAQTSIAAGIIDVIRHAVLPVLTLALARMGNIYLLARSNMMMVLSQDYMRTATAKGLHKMRVIFRHGLSNALPPIVTRIFMSIGTMFGAAMLVENVFHYPGMGYLMREAVLVRDYALIQGVFLFVALSVLGMNFLADIIYCKMDPRID